MLGWHGAVQWCEHVDRNASHVCKCQTRTSQETRTHMHNESGTRHDGGTDNCHSTQTHCAHT